MNIDDTFETPKPARTARSIALPLLAAAALFAAGCIIEEVDHSLYLDPDGGVGWVAVERDVRSIADEDDERARQEAEYLEQVMADGHPIAVALRLLGGDPRSVAIRDRRPFVVVTETRFAAADRLAEALFESVGIPAEARFERAGDERSLEIVARLAERADERARDEIDALITDRLDRFRIVLTAGELIDAIGFEPVDEGTAAILLPIDEKADAVRLVLRWRVPPGRAGAERDMAD